MSLSSSVNQVLRSSCCRLPAPAPAPGIIPTREPAAAVPAPPRPAANRSAVGLAAAGPTGPDGGRVFHHPLSGTEVPGTPAPPNPPPAPTAPKLPAPPPPPAVDHDSGSRDPLPAPDRLLPPAGPTPAGLSPASRIPSVIDDGGDGIAACRAVGIAAWTAPAPMPAPPTAPKLPAP